MAYVNPELLALLKKTVGADKFSQMQKSTRSVRVFAEIKTVMSKYGFDDDDKRGSAHYVLTAICKNAELSKTVADAIGKMYPQKISVADTENDDDADE